MAWHAMHVHTGLKRLTSVTLLTVAAGCAGKAKQTETAPSCAVGDQCQLKGTLNIMRGVPASVGILETKQGCVPLALPDEIYREFDRWDGKHVVVSGEGFSGDRDAEVIAVELKGRLVATSLCTSAPVIVYVTQIKKR